MSLSLIEVIVKSDVMDEGEDADNKHLKNWNGIDHIESFTTNKDDVLFRSPFNTSLTLLHSSSKLNYVHFEQQKRSS